MMTKQITRRAPRTTTRSPANDNQRLRLVRGEKGIRLDFPETKTPRNLPSRAMRNTYRLWRVGKRGFYRLPITTYLDILEELAKVTLHSNAGIAGWKNLGPWSLYGQCSDGYSGPPCLITGTIVTNSSFIRNFANGCIAGQAFNEDTIGDPWAYVTDAKKSVLLGSSYRIADSYRAKSVEAYTRPSSGAFEKPTWSNGGVAFLVNSTRISIRAEREMMFDPMKLPVVEPRPEFLPPVPSRFRDWSHPQREAGYSHPDARSPSLSPQSYPNLYSIAIANYKAGAKADSVHEKNPPDRNEKELKLKVSPTMAKAISLVDQLTEGVDFIGAIYSALPERYQVRYRDTPYVKKYPTPQEMLIALVMNFNHVSVPMAIYNLGYEQLEDKLFGTLGKIGAEASKNVGLNYGMGFNTLTTQIRNGIYYQYRKFNSQE